MYKTSSRLRYLESKAPRGNPALPPAAFLFDHVDQKALENAIIAVVATSVWSAEIDQLGNWGSAREIAIGGAKDLYGDLENSLKALIYFDALPSLNRDRRHAFYHWQHSSYLIGQLFDQLIKSPLRKVKFSQFVDIATQCLNGSLLEVGLEQAKNGYTLRGLIAEPTLVTSIKEVDREYLSFLASHPNVLDKIAWQALERIAYEIFSQYGFDVYHVGTQWGESADLLLINRHIDGRKQSCIVECKRYRNDRKVGLDIVNSVLGAKMRAGADAAILLTTGKFSNHVKNEREKLRTLKLELRDGVQLIEWLQAHYAKQDALLTQPKYPEEVWLPPGWERK